MSSPTPSLTAEESSSEFDAAAENLIRVSKINISELELISFTESPEWRCGIEDRATRGTEAGGPQAKRSGGVSEANVREATISGLVQKSSLQTQDRYTGAWT
jgi:hypothetical protein